MTARAAIFAALALALAALVWWVAPWLLDLLGLSEFVFIGRFCGVVLALSILERLFDRYLSAKATH